jgi:hypothetical protein
VLRSNLPEKLSDEPPESFSPNRANTVFLILIEPKKIFKKILNFFYLSY